MAATQFTSRQLGAASVTRDDLDTTTTTKAVVSKIIAGTNITLGSTGVDAGTGDVTINASGGGGSADIKQTEVDFGITPVAEATFTITDAGVIGTSQVIASVAYEAPTGKDLDEIEMDDLIIRCGNGAGQFNMFIKTADGSYLADKFKINYLVG